MSKSEHATPERRERRHQLPFEVEDMPEAEVGVGDLCKALIEVQGDMGEGFLMLEGRRIRYANETFCSITGRSVAALEALATLSELVVLDQRSIVEDLMRRYLSGEAVGDRREITILRKSGERVDLEVVLRPLRKENEPIRLLVLARDITRRKRTQEKLQGSLGALMAIHETGRLLNLGKKATGLL